MTGVASSSSGSGCGGHKLAGGSIFFPLLTFRLLLLLLHCFMLACGQETTGLRMVLLLCLRLDVQDDFDRLFSWCGKGEGRYVCIVDGEIRRARRS